MAKMSAEQIAAMAEKFGVETNLDSIQEAISNVPTDDEVREARQERLREADGVLRSLHYPHQLTMKICAWCGDPFQTNYCSVGCCSENCRKRYLEDRYKIRWTPTKTRVWGEYESPMVISAESVAQLRAWAIAFLEDYDNIIERMPEILQRQEETGIRRTPESHQNDPTKTPGLDALLQKWGEAPTSDEDSELPEQHPNPLPEPHYAVQASPPELPALPDFDSEDFPAFGA